MSIGNIASNAASRFGYLSHASKLPSNMVRLAKQAGSEFIHEPQSFKSNALILSSALLVTARILLVNFSTLKAKTHEEREYRRFEAIKTTMREAGGWLFSFAVLRAFQMGMSKGLQKLFHIAPNPETGNGSKFGATLKEMFLQPFYYLFRNAEGMDIDNKMIKGKGKLMDASVLDRPAVKYDLLPNPPVKWGRDLLNWLVEKKPFHVVPSDAISEEAKAAAVKLAKEKSIGNVMQYLPLMVGGVVAIGLSGFFLEWFSNHKAKTVANKLNKILGKPVNMPNIAQTLQSKAGPGVTYPIGSIANLIRARQQQQHNPLPALETFPPLTGSTPHSIASSSKPASRFNVIAG